MTTKSVFVTLAGHTNAGKSSLLNAIIGEKIASVSPKPQTTRTRITGIKTIGETQMVFMDTPGLHKPTTKLSDHMLKAVRDAVSDIDAVLFVQDCTKPLSQQEEELLGSLERAKTPVILVLNKIDLCSDKTKLMQAIASLNAAHTFAATVPVSVTENDGVDLVEQEVMAPSSERRLPRSAPSPRPRAPASRASRPSEKRRWSLWTPPVCTSPPPSSATTC